MFGAIVGDIVGSRFEFNNHKSKDFAFLHPECHFTDDSIMTLAIAKTLIKSQPDFKNLATLTIQTMQDLGRIYPDAGYGPKFQQWLASKNPQPYSSYGNGAAMRVEACALAASTLSQAQALALAVTNISHNHPEGIKGALATTSAIFLAKKAQQKQLAKTTIYNYITQNYYPLDFTLDAIRKTYAYDLSCQGSVPQALVAFFEAEDFEDAIRNAISIGGDSDTIAAITGSVAAAYYTIPDAITEKILSYLDARLIKIIRDFAEVFQK